MKFDPSHPVHKSLKYRLSQAFKENGNMIGIAGVIATAAALVTPIPLLVGLIAEAAYLLFVPDSKWYEKRLQKKFDGEVEARRRELKEQIYPLVRPQIRSEFERLEQVRNQISAQSQSEEPWFREAMRKLDFLMEKFLQFAQKESQFGMYLNSVYQEVYEQSSQNVRREMRSRVYSPKDGEDRSPVLEVNEEWVEGVIESVNGFYERELEKLANEIESESVMANRSLMEKRQQILTRRKDFILRVGQILSNLRLQMRLMSDTFGLINDEIRARSPEQVLSDIDDVMLQATSLTEAIDEITPMAELVGTTS